MFKASSGYVHESKTRGFVCLTVAGAAQAEGQRTCPLLLPVELQCVNHTTSTNSVYCMVRALTVGLQFLDHSDTMPQPHTLDQFADRVEQLLVRYMELQRTNALLAEQLVQVSAERDSLKSRLHAARARVDALLTKLTPTDTP